MPLEAIRMTHDSDAIVRKVAATGFRNDLFGRQLNLGYHSHPE